MKKAIDLEAGTVTFSDDSDNVIAVVAYVDLTREMVRQAALHGISQKVGDSYAGALKATDGLDLTPEAWSIQRVKDSVEQIARGDWNLRTGGSTPAATDLAVAIAEATGSTVDEVAAKLAGLKDTPDEGKEVKKALRANPQVAAILARIKAERATKKQAELDAKAADAPALQF